MYQQIVDTRLVEKLLHQVLGVTTIMGEKLLHFWILLQFWFKSYYVSGFTTLQVIYYVSGSNIWVLTAVWVINHGE